ncbi:hypothetical protein ACFWJ4_21560 [Kitasatospora sp. NPDC127067]|uniref:hypothetical protein n=1 Tax=Kitasatospora sp. NPDC127067 TaxID=3347126 RepID=UPI0036522B11
MTFRTMATAAILALYVAIGSSASALAADPDMPIWTAPAAESLPIWTASTR